MYDRLTAKLDESYTIRTLEEMVRIRSVVGEEAALAEYLRNRLNSLGFRTELHEVERNRPNIYACLPSGRAGRRLMFNGHMDTVPISEGWETDPFTPIVKEGRIHGLGACDMKAGLACMLSAFKAIVDSQLDHEGELLFSGVIDEEGYSKGAKAMLKTPYRKCDAIVLGEPYPGDESKPIPLGLTGKVLYDVTVKGKAAHGFRPHLGINAIEEAAHVIASLNRIKMITHSRFGKGNLCTLKIEGGYAVYSVVVPEKCHFEVNRLLVPGETSQTAVQDFNELLKELNLRGEVEVSVKPPTYEPFEMSPEEPILKTFEQVYRQVRGVDPLYEYSIGVSDANVFTGESGIPCVHLGPKRGGTHQPNEYVPLDWLQPVAKMYALIAARFLNGSK